MKTSLQPAQFDLRPLPRFRLLPSISDAFPPDEPSQYELLVKIGSGGTASVFIGRFTGSTGFSRLFAIKKPHPHLLDDPAAQRMLANEARLASRIHHANVVAVHDVECRDGGVLLVMEYVEGASLSELIETGKEAKRPLPHRIAIRVALDACHGLSAVHELCDETGRVLGFVHRDVSPQNILIGVDGTARITDLGLARHMAGDRNARALGGKLAYLAPEVIDDHCFSAQSDVFAMGVVLWEAIAHKRLFRGLSEADTVRRVGLVEAPLVSRVARSLGSCLDNVVANALEKSPYRRYRSVREMAGALEEVAQRHELIASTSEVTAYMEEIMGETIARRRRLVREWSGASSSDLLFQDTVSFAPHQVPLRALPHAEIELTPTDVRAAGVEELGTGDFLDLDDEAAGDSDEQAETRPMQRDSLPPLAPPSDALAMPSLPAIASLPANDEGVDEEHLVATRKIRPPMKSQLPAKETSDEIPIVFVESDEVEGPLDRFLAAEEPVSRAQIEELLRKSESLRRVVEESIAKALPARASVAEAEPKKVAEAEPKKSEVEAPKPTSSSASEGTTQPSRRVLLERSRDSKILRERSTLPPAPLRSAAVRSRSLRVGLVAVIALELAVVFGLMAGVIPRPATPLRATPIAGEAASAAATAHVAIAMKSAKFEPAEPRASATTGASASVAAITPGAPTHKPPAPAVRAPRPRAAMAPRPSPSKDDVDAAAAVAMSTDDKAKDAVANADATPTARDDDASPKTSPLARARVKAKSEPHDDDDAIADLGGAAAKAPPNPYKN